MEELNFQVCWYGSKHLEEEIEDSEYVHLQVREETLVGAHCVIWGNKFLSIFGKDF